jgi:predicted ABC-type ATPase
VLNGGHSIPNEIIHRRYIRSISNFIKIYIPLADSWSLYDNSYANPIIIAEKKLQNIAKIFDSDIWELLTGANYE